MALDDFDDGWPPSRTPAMDTRVIQAIHGAEHAVSHRLGLSTREHGLDPSEALVLTAIQQDPGCAPWEIRRRIGLHRSTLSSILDRLELESQIERRAGVAGRRFDLRLTPAGRIAADLAEDVVASVEAEIAGYTSRAERHGAVAVYEACRAIGRRERGMSD
jgi:DNA-binding MarR family transcriptional regulator